MLRRGGVHLGSGLRSLLWVVLALCVACVGEPPVDSDQDPIPSDVLRDVVRRARETGAVGAFSEALAQYPDSPTLSRAHQDHLRGILPSEAFLLKYRARAEAEPGSSLAQYLLGRAVIEDRDTAYAAFRRAAGLDPLNPWPVIGMAYLHANEGDLFGTTNVYKAGIEAAPRSALLHLFLGNQYLDMRLHVKAQREYEIVRTLAPDNHEARAGLGKVYAMLLRFDQARELLESVREVDPSVAHIYPTLASLYLQERKPRAAAAAYRTGLNYGLPPDESLAAQIRAAELVVETER